MSDNKKRGDVVIAKNGKPEARLLPFEPKPKDGFGMDERKIWMADFNELPEDVLYLMSDPKIFPDETSEDEWKGPRFSSWTE